jgi:hypothetical protein
MAGRPYPASVAMHEAAHAVIAVALGGYAEAISLSPGQCHVSWPDDGVDRSREQRLTMAAGPAANAVHGRIAQTTAILMFGLSDIRRMEEIGDAGDEVFAEARKLCRRHWPKVVAVAAAAQRTGVLSETEIMVAIEVSA